MRLPGFDASNFIEGKNQIVDVVIEGKESQIAALKEFIENNKPAEAIVSGITTSDYDGDVMRIAEYSQVLTAMQMLKAIPTMLKIGDNTALIPEIAKNTALIPEIAKNTALIPEIAKNTALIPEVAKNTKLIPQMAKNTEKILEEVRGIREEIQPGLGEQLRQMQSDIRALKDRAGML